MNDIKEKWIKWELFGDTPKIYYIESIIDGPNQFEIILADSNPNIKDEGQRIRINFGYGVDAYRSTDEGLRLKLWGELDKEYGKEFYAKENFFKVENSEYLKWLESESGWYVDAMKPTHYVFMDSDCVLDVVAKCEPEVEIFKK